MKTLAAALAPLWQRKLIWLAETALLAVAFALLYVWLALPVSSVWYLLAHIGVALTVLALLLLAARLAGPVHGPICWRRTLRSPWFALAVAIWVVTALWLPYQLLWWIPNLDSLPAQALSAACRFALAGALLTGASLWLATCAARLGEEPAVWNASNS